MGFTAIMRTPSITENGKATNKSVTNFGTPPDNVSQNGFGRETWADGSKFAGHFTDGVKDGHGLYAWGDGSHYAGQWVANKSEGYGRFTSQPLDDEEDREGKQYRGGWKNGMMCGVGEYLWDTGQSYSGHYIEDQKVRVVC